jgi:hypothetical protein
MPQLARLRFLRVGHKEARADDLTLEFLDHGRPTDTTLWLRNGGGKSSLLALFFSMMVPNKRQFLGKAESGLRELGDYVARGEIGVVAAEWILDGPNGTLELLDSPDRRLITGTALEWNEPRGDDDPALERTFFSWRTVPGTPASSLEGLAHATRGGRNAIRQTWTALRQRAPQAEAMMATAVGEWVDQLESVGLDPRLFAAQATMNQGEGEADRLFADLRTGDDYARYFLTLLAPPDLAEPILNNLEAHRAALRHRQTASLPEQALVAGLRERIAAAVEIQRQRAGHAEQVERGLAKATALDAALGARAETAAANVAEAEAEVTRQRKVADDARNKARAATQEATWLLRGQAQQAVAAAEREGEEVDREHELALKAAKLWGAVHTYATVRRHEATAARLQAQLIALEAEHRPLRGEVEDAARALAGALEARRQQAQRDRDEAERSRTAANTVFQQARTEETQAVRDAADAGGRLADARRRRTEAARELQGLQAHHALRDGEAVCDGLHRQQVTLDAALATIAQVDRDRRQTEEQRAAARTSAGQAAERGRTAAGETARRTEALAHAAGEADTLNADPDLARLLELDQGRLDVRRLDADAVTRLRTIASEATERVLARQVDVASESRTIQHLEAHGTLPPSPIVERLLRVLRDHLDQAWDGWRYLQENFPLAEAQAVVVRAPAVATGLIVRDQHFAKARALLGPEIIGLEEPVLLTPASAVTADTASGIPVGAVVLGPGDEAHYNAEAGERALASRRARHRATLRLQEEASALQATATERALQLESWQRRFPAAWFRDTEGALATAQHQFATAAADQATHDATIEAADAALRGIAERRDAARQAEAAARRALEQLRDWQRRHTTGLEGYDVQATSAEVAQTAAEERATTARAHQRHAETQWTEAEQRRSDALRVAEQSERELKQIQFGPAGDVTPVPGDPVTLRQIHVELLQAYNDRVGAHALSGQIAAATEEAAQHRDALQKQCGTSLSMVEVEGAFGEIVDPAEALRRQGEAEARRATVFQRMGTVHNTLAKMQARLADAEQAWIDAGGLELSGIALSASEPETLERIRVARATARREEGVAAGADEAIALAQAMVQEERVKAERALETRGALEVTLSGLRTLAMALGRKLGPLPEVGPLNDASIREQRDALSRFYGEKDQALRALDGRRDAAHHAVQTWCDDPRFVPIPESVGPRIKRFTAAQLEGQAEELAEELAQRARMIDEDLAASDRDRNTLIHQVRSTAREGAQLLKKLAQNSMIPMSIPNLGGHALLQCQLRLPETEEEGAHRMGTLLDEYVAKGELPGPAAFLQAAVLRLAGPIALRVLRPTMDTMANYEAITTLGKFSGGEKLTVATLIYCALATTRAQTVGRRKEPTGTLLMDNPFGKASRASFITLQREVARHLGIQLVYLTGINDLEALRCFPTVVRLENARYDRRTGERVVEVGDPEETRSLLSAVRISRRESANGGPAPASPTA